VTKNNNAAYPALRGQIHPMRKIYLFLSVLFCSLQSTFSQSSPAFELGLKISKEFSGGKDDGGGIGIQSVYKIARHSGIETGIFYKVKAIKYIGFQNINPTSMPFYEPFTESEKTILIPLNYRFESGLLNFTVGTGLNFLLNKSDFKDINPEDKTDWKNNNMEMLLSGGISKSFRLNKTLIAEPEIKFCHYSAGGGSGFQLSLAFRRRF
jgi:hypothetical protein